MTTLANRTLANGITPVPQVHHARAAHLLRACKPNLESRLPRPGGTYFISSQQRLLTVEEKLLLQGVPIDVSDLSGNTLSELGKKAGNAMHTRAAAAAWVCVLGCVDIVKLKQFNDVAYAEWRTMPHMSARVAL